MTFLAPLAIGFPTLDSLGKFAVFLVTVSILVVLHEAGHFWLARWNGVRVNDFAVGMGPTLLKWTSMKTGTNYLLNILPIGGYCAMQGEDGKTTEAEQQRAFRGQTAGATSDNFQAKRPIQRLAIVVAGPIANFILAFAIFFVGAAAFGVVADGAKTTTQVGTIEHGSPAERAGLHLGDTIVAIDGVRYATGEAAVAKIQRSIGKPLHFSIRREGRILGLVITPKPFRDPATNKTIGRVGFIRMFSLSPVGPLGAVKFAANQFVMVMAMQFAGYTSILSNPIAHASEVSGIIGMSRAASSIQDLGWSPYFNLAGAISIALGLINLLPFPALDGGRGVFIIAEMLRGRPVEPEKEALVHVTGFAVLMVLMVVVAFHDIANIVAGKGVL